MTSRPASRWLEWLCLVLVVAVAAGARGWYVWECVGEGRAGAAPFLAQVETPAGESLLGDSRPGQLKHLIDNIAGENWFGSRAPLSAGEEETAHVAPGYPWAVAMMYRVAGEDAVPVLRWVQCGLGALTAGLYFVFARLAFGNLAVALLTGLLCAVNPFWIVNVAQVGDGVLASLLLAGVLVFGTHAARGGDALSSLLFGLTLAALSLVRAALFPFAVVGLLWFLRKSRDLPRGWLFALLAVLGFVNGVVPWGVRNYQAFGDIVPVVDSAWLHLWMGNNPAATGAELDHATTEIALGPVRAEELKMEPSQSRRYQMLAQDTAAYVIEHPDQTLKNRILAGLYFFLGRDWFTEQTPGEAASDDTAVPDWLRQSFPTIINGSLMGMLLLALLGWRCTLPWRNQTGLATLALIWVPLPYLLSHAESLWGPRLPLDGLLLCYAAFVLVRLVPGAGGKLAEGPPAVGLREV